MVSGIHHIKWYNHPTKEKNSQYQRETRDWTPKPNRLASSSPCAAANCKGVQPVLIGVVLANNIERLELSFDTANRGDWEGQVPRLNV